MEPYDNGKGLPAPGLAVPPSNRVMLLPPRGAGKSEILKVLFKNQKVIFDFLQDIQRQLTEINRRFSTEINDKVVAELGDKIHMIESAITESVIHKKILVKKGFITIDEVNKAYEELRNA